VAYGLLVNFMSSGDEAPGQIVAGTVGFECDFELVSVALGWSVRVRMLLRC
jgi:hypothetical protein